MTLIKHDFTTPFNPTNPLNKFLNNFHNFNPKIKSNQLDKNFLFIQPNYKFIYDSIRALSLDST